MRLYDIIPIHPYAVWFHFIYDEYIEEFIDQFFINEQHQLLEGDLLSHPRNLVVKHLLSQFSNNIYIYPIEMDLHNILIQLSSDNNVNIDKLLQFITKMGWYISDIQLGINNVPFQQGLKALQDNDYDKAIITIEASKTTNDNKEVGDTKGIDTNIPKWLYHVTPTQLWKSKISKVGLAPRSKSTRSNHPSRIYVTTNSKLAEQLIPDISRQRINQSKTKKYDVSKFNPMKYYKDWAILQIDTSKLSNVRGLGYFTLYKDPNVLSKNGMSLYTINYIPPTAISMVKRITL